MNVMSLMATMGIDTSAYDEGLNNATSSAHQFAGTIKKILGAVAIGTAVTKTISAVVNLTKSAVTAYGEYEQLIGGVETLFGAGGKSFEQYAQEASKNMFKVGQTGKDIIELQKRLNEEGAGLVVDGIYGPKTQAALEKYQNVSEEISREQYDNLKAAEEQMTNNAWSAFERVGVDANTYMSTVTSFSASLIQSLGGDTDRAVELADQAMVDMADKMLVRLKRVEPYQGCGAKRPQEMAA